MSQVTIIRTDGSREEHERTDKGSKLLDWIAQQIGAETTDTVNLRDGRIMILDDHGYETEIVQKDATHIELRPVRALKPVNAAATDLYWAVCQPGTEHEIVGDVAIAWDKDFA